jgi:hypothetical protein
MSFYDTKTVADKLAQIHNERRLREAPPQPSTYFQQAKIGESLDQPGGRYRTGSGSDQWPRLPEGSPWADGPSPGLEPPLGEALGPAPIVGEAHEVARSLEEFANGETAGSRFGAAAVDPSISVRDPSPEGTLSPHAGVAEPSSLLPLPSGSSPPLVTGSTGVERGGSAISFEDEAALKALLSRGLKRRKL